MASAATRRNSKKRTIQRPLKQVIHACRKKRRQTHAAEAGIQLVVVRVALYQRAQRHGQKRAERERVRAIETQKVPSRGHWAHDRTQAVRGRFRATIKLEGKNRLNFGGSPCGPCRRQRCTSACQFLQLEIAWRALASVAAQCLLWSKRDCC